MNDTDIELLKFISNYMLKRKTKTPKQAEKKVRFACLTWGKHVTLMEQISMRSLFQEGNIPNLLKEKYKVTIEIHTIEQDLQKIISIIECYDQAHNKGNDNSLNFIIQTYDHESAAKENFLTSTMQSAIDENEILFMAPPDIFFGNKSAFNIIEFSRSFNSCIAAPHLRVNEASFITDLAENNETIDNSRLVNLCLSHAHQNATDSFISKTNCSNYTGISIIEMNENTLALTARIPTIFAARPISDDINFFKKTTNYNGWDHAWPTLLMIQGRYKQLNSSDLFFAVETTPSNSHLCPCNQPPWSDEYIPNHDQPLFLHKMLNANSIAIIKKSS